MSKSSRLTWHKVLESSDEILDKRVRTVLAGHKEICLSKFEDAICALDNKCPHQGGPLGEGSIENGILRCPWHGWDYHPCTGKAPGFDDGVDPYPVEERKDGVYIGLPEEQAHESTLSDIMAETMVNWGVDTVFGMVGHSNLGLADALKRLEEKDRLKFIAIRHEGAGAFAASAYGKLTGKPAACFSIAGPGATNMFTGLWDAKVDRAPILASQHAELMTLAIKHALIKRDVSHLTFPDEIQEVPAGEASAQTPDGRISPMKIAPSKESLDKALGLITKSQRPVIIAGHGARFDMEAITGFAEKLKAPVLTTFKGKGLISDSHPLAAGVLGRSGTPVASYFMNESDLLIVLGASFSNHTGITPKKPTIQVDLDPLALAKFHKIDVPVWGEISLTLAMIQDVVRSTVKTTDQRPELAKRWKIWRDEKKKRLKEDRGRGVSSIKVFDSLSRLVPENAVICVDVGNNAYSLGRYFESRKQSFLMSGYLGSIGFAYPAALGAWAATRGERPVIAVAGDGGFAQYMAELTTSVKYNMDIKLILLNNSELGKISKEQRSGGFDVFATDLHNPGFANYANDCGALGVKVSSQNELDAAVKKILEHQGTALLEIITDVALI